MNSGFLANANVNELDTSLEVTSAEVTPIENPSEDNNETQTSVKDTVNWQKRYSDQQRYVTRLQNEKLELEKQLKNAQTKPLEVPRTKEQLDDFRKQYPELFDTLISLTRLEVTEQSKQLDEERKEVLKKIADIESEKLILEVAKVHKDAIQIRNDSKFHAWLADQSNAVKALFESSNPKDPIKGLYLYKEDMGIKSPRDKKIEAAAVTPTGGTDIPTGGKKVWKQSEVQKLSAADYKKYREDIIEAMQTEGRYVKDLTP